MHMPVNEAGDAGFAVQNCDWVLGVKSVSGLLLLGDTMVSIGSSVLCRFSASSLYCLRYMLILFMNWAPQET